MVRKLVGTSKRKIKNDLNSIYRVLSNSNGMVQDKIARKLRWHPIRVTKFLWYLWGTKVVRRECRGFRVVWYINSDKDENKT